MKYILALLLSFVCITSYAQQATVTLDRAWGLLLGDELTATAILPENHKTLDSNAFPQTQRRVGTWLYLKDLQQIDSTLLFSYQVVNVPKENTVIETPIYELSDVDGNILTIPSSKMSIGPLLSLEKEGRLQLKPDHPPIVLPTKSYEQQLQSTLSVAIIISLVLLVWHFGWKPRNRQPFAQAVYELSRLRWQRSKDANQPARILHAAFNQTAGTIVAHKELSQFLATTPWLASLETDIDTFYQTSSGHFFTKEAGQGPALTDIVKLAKACRAKEKLA